MICVTGGRTHHVCSGGHPPRQTVLRPARTGRAGGGGWRSRLGSAGQLDLEDSSIENDDSSMILQHQIMILLMKNDDLIKDVDVPALGCAAYTGNLHKWLYSPKGTAMLWYIRFVFEMMFVLKMMICAIQMMIFVFK